MLSVLIFAHVPPPHHGQSYMVAQLLEELRARPDAIRVFHVDSRVSDTLEEVGRPGGSKVFRLLRHCLRAIWLRWLHGPMVLYYVPAPAKRSAVFRDWLVLTLCRPFFRHHLVLHWHAVGLGEWTRAKAGSPASFLTRRLLGGARISLVLAQAVAADAAVFHPEQVTVLPNGIPDPCPDFETVVLPVRRSRAQERGKSFRVLFLAHCLREKGLYDALEGVFHAQKELNAEQSAIRLTFLVAGQFLSEEDRGAFLEAVFRLTAASPEEPLYPEVKITGFVAGEAKERVFRESDCFCFPTYYPNEVMPVSLIEALAYGLPIVSTRWRAIPEMLPEAGCLLVDARQPEQVGRALRQMIDTTAFPALRAHYLSNFQRGVFGQRFRSTLAEAFPAGSLAGAKQKPAT